MDDLTLEDFERAQRELDALGPPPQQIAHLTLGENVVKRLVDEGLLRYDELREAYYLPMGVVGMGLHGFGDVPVHVSKAMPDLIFGQYTDGDCFTNVEPMPPHEK